MRRWGRVRCLGDVRVWRCSACKINEWLHIPPAASYLVTAMGQLSGWLAFGPSAQGLRRRLAFVADTRRLRRELRHFLSTSDRVISPCEWTRQALLANGSPAAAIVHCPQGVDRDFIEAARVAVSASARSPVPAAEPFVVGYVGRLSPEKGIRPLVEAFTRTRYEAARLRLIGWSPSKNVAEYEESVRLIAARDPRVEFRPTVPANRMPGEYAGLSLLAVPPTSMESGPLVLLEGLQMGVPVWGSDSVGQIHLLERHGKVVRPNTAEAWQAALETAFEAHRRGEWPSRSARLPIPMRTMEDVGRDVVALYRELLERRQASG
jgi:phosphatidylinositol alpha 1,6-mannosyltransferase